MAEAPRTGRWAFVLDHSLLLVAGALAALAWANIAPDSYARFADATHFAVNDIGMAFFFALAAKEIVEATLPGGSLSSVREAAVPLVAAVGGMAAPAGIYLALAAAAGRPDLVPGWAVPCATDIAFSYLAARLIFPAGHPAIPFLLLLAIADDAMGLVLLAVFYPAAPVSVVTFVGLLLPALGVAYWLRRRGVKSHWPYAIGAGGISWAAFLLGGLHPALALVPIVPFMPHEPRDLGLFDRAELDRPETLNRFERFWHVPVEFILLAFGLVNAGVAASGVGTGTWIALGSLVAGKPVGIVGLTVLAVAAGLRPPGGLSYRHTAVVGLTAGVGFTVALFFATAAFPRGATLDEVKMGALLSIVAAPLAIMAARLSGLRPRGGA